jgi:hypothetical protein
MSAKLVVIQPWEFGGVPREWVTSFGEHATEVWVYTSWLQDCYELSGVDRAKLHVVPLAVDLDVFAPSGDEFELRTDKACRFLFVGGAIERKGIDVLLKAYTNEFSADDDVTLVLKSSPKTYPGTSLSAMVETSRTIPGCPEILLIEDDLTDNEMAALHRSCTALVHPYRGEGFGLPMLESLACGRPVVATNYGAALDFLDETVAFLIPATVRYADLDHRPDPSVGYWWAEPDPAALSAILRRLCDSRSLASDLAEACRDRAQKFTWDRTAQLITERLLALAPAHAVLATPYELDSPKARVILVRASEQNPTWRALLVNYLDAVSGDDDATLVVWIEPGIATPELRMEEVRTIISARRPTNEPDILIVVEPWSDTNAVSLLLAAPTVLTDADTQEATLARRLDCTFISITDENGQLRKLLGLAELS